MISRRQLVAALGTLPAAGLLSPGSLYAQAARQFPRRTLGRTGVPVVPLGLGGQASLQWTKPGIDAPDIIVRAVQLGLNYLDTANVYGASQMQYGEAFRRLHLTPSDSNYNRALRGSLYIATKTRARFALDPANQPTAIDDLKRSLTQIFGDGKGFIPDGAYLDAIQCHNLQALADVDQIYEGLADRGTGKPERIGALAGLLDYRDGTNYTGLNPEHRIWVRHIGITGHFSSAVLMSAIRRDTADVIDTVLVALNANDRTFSAHQNNVLPLARARGLGVIAMKIFADGAFYGKEPHFSTTPADVNLAVGKNGAIAYSDLVRYPLSLPGVSCEIIGTGHIDRQRQEADQMVANLAASLQDLPSETERLRIENDAAARHAGSNYFQEKRGLVQPSGVKIKRDGDRLVVMWNTALAGAEPIQSYEIRAGQRTLLTLPFRPQLTEAPITAIVPVASIASDPVTVIASEAPPRARA